MSTAAALLTEAAPSAVTPTAPDGGAADPVIAAAVAPAAPASTGKWYDGMQDAELKGYVENKGWKTPEDAMASYRGLERLVGVDKIPMPKGDDDKEGYERVYAALGRPAKAEDYKLPVPDGMDRTFASQAEAKFHELGLSAKQASALAEWNNEFLATQMKGQQESAALQTEQDVTALKREWGPAAFDENIALGRKAAQEFEITPHIDKLEQALGTKATLELLSRIGRGLTEHTFEGGKTTAGFGMTPEAAKAEIAQLQGSLSKPGDKEFMALYLAGDSKALARMERLQKIAYGQ
jgi:hypothetical protein